MKINELKEKILSLKAYCDIPIATCCEEVKCAVDYDEIKYLRSEIQSLYRYLFDLEDALRKHKNDGHLPVIPGAAKMQEILEILNLQNDYEVEKKEIYASNGKSEKTVITLTPKIK